MKFQLCSDHINGLKGALKTDVLVPHFQPLEGLDTARVCIGPMRDRGGEYVLLRRGNVIDYGEHLEPIYLQAVAFLQMGGDVRDYPPVDLL